MILTRTVFELQRGFSSESSLTAVFTSRDAAIAIMASISSSVLPRSRNDTLDDAHTYIRHVSVLSKHRSTGAEKCRNHHSQVLYDISYKLFCGSSRGSGDVGYRHSQVLYDISECTVTRTSRYRATAMPPAFPMGFPFRLRCVRVRFPAAARAETMASQPRAVTAFPCRSSRTSVQVYEAVSCMKGPIARGIVPQ